VLRERRQEKRRVRASVRLLGEELDRGKSWIEPMLEEGSWKFEPGEQSSARWSEHGAFLAEHIKNHLLWFVIANGFESLRIVARATELGAAGDEPLDKKSREEFGSPSLRFRRSRVGTSPRLPLNVIGARGPRVRAVFF
jgi:hypothetical protein